jgi:hypothetical protein
MVFLWIVKIDGGSNGLYFSSSMKNLFKLLMVSYQDNVELSKLAINRVHIFCHLLQIHPPLASFGAPHEI